MLTGQQEASCLAEKAQGPRSLEPGASEGFVKDELRERVMEITSNYPGLCLSECGASYSSTVVTELGEGQDQQSPTFTLGEMMVIPNIICHYHNFTERRTF